MLASLNFLLIKNKITKYEKKTSRYNKKILEYQITFSSWIFDKTNRYTNFYKQNFYFFVCVYEKRGFCKDPIYIFFFFLKSSDFLFLVFLISCPKCWDLDDILKKTFCDCMRLRGLMAVIGQCWFFYSIQRILTVVYRLQIVRKCLSFNSGNN